MVRTVDESRVESPEEILSEREQARQLIERGEMEASLTHVRDTTNGDTARFRQMRFGFVVDSISLGGNTPKRYFFNGRHPDLERRNMKEFLENRVHGRLALMLDAMNALRYDPGAKSDRTAPQNFSQINRPLEIE